MKNKTTILIVACVAVLLLVLAIGGSLLDRGESDRAAYDLTEKWVKSQLRPGNSHSFADSTVELCGYKRAHISKVGTNTYTIFGWAATKSADGVSTRQPWYSKMKYMGRGRWTFVEIAVNGRWIYPLDLNHAPATPVPEDH